MVSQRSGLTLWKIIKFAILATILLAILYVVFLIIIRIFRQGQQQKPVFPALMEKVLSKIRNF